MWCARASTEKAVPTASGAAPSISTGSSESGSSYGTTSRSEGGEMTFRGYKIPIAFSVLVWCLVWEVVGRLGLISLIPPFTEVLGAMPALIALLGFGLSTMIVTVFVFSVWVIALDTQVGVERVSPSLVEMGRSFGASKRDLYLKILFFAALPELLAGIRLGLIRGLKGVIIGQLLIAVVGMGYLFELYSRSFLMPEFWALLILLFASAFLASEAVAYFERKVSFYATAR